MIKLKVPEGTESIGFGSTAFKAEGGVIQVDDARIAAHLCAHAGCSVAAEDPEPVEPEPKRKRRAQTADDTK